MEHNLTQGSLVRNMLRFAIPYLVSCFLQTFYGMADLFITGQFNGSGAVSAVAIGSQVMHMLTVVIVGLAMGTTVLLSRATGANDRERAAVCIGNSAILFSAIAVVTTLILLAMVDGVLGVLSTPPEAYAQARQYLIICFAGIPFITAYNIVSSIYRGLGDTKSPMIFVAVSGLINVGADYVLIGPFGMGAAGAAIATVCAQAISVGLAVTALVRRENGVKLTRSVFRPDALVFRQLAGIGFPIAVQEGLIQVSFLTITAIANSRGIAVAAAVGIVEKIISFLFLVSSAMLSTVSAVTAQNAGAGLHARGRKTLFCGAAICAGFGVIAFLACQIGAEWIIGCFVKGEPEVVRLGGQYLRAYTLDCIFAGVHFCFSGYFSAYGKSLYAFIHNIISILTLRIPGAWLASVYFPDNLYPMGLAAPMGSLLSVIICVALYKLKCTDEQLALI